MMRFLRQRRRLLAGLVLVVIGVVALVAALPVWLPWVLRPVAARFGLNYQDYTREGYSRFALTGLSFTNKNLGVAAERVEMFQPTAWLWQRYVGQRGEVFARVWDWQVNVAPRQKPPASVYTNYVKVEESLAELEKWVPRAVLTNGVVLVQGERIEIPGVEWDHGQLSAEVVWPRQIFMGVSRLESLRLPRRAEDRSWRSAYALPSQAHEKGARHGQRGHVRVSRQGGKPDQVQFRSETLEVEGTLAVSSRPEGLGLEGTVFWLTNRIELGAKFNRTDMIPTAAQVQAKAFRVPAQHMGLQGYQDVQGSLALTWQTNRFALDLTVAAHAQPETKLPTVEAVVQAGGSTNAAIIETVRIQTSWLQAQLRERTRVQFTPPYLSEPATVVVEADLSRQPWFNAQGQLAGQVRLQPSSTRFPEATFTLAGSQLGVAEVQASALELAGKFDWPWLTLATGEVALAGDANAFVQGRVNVAERTIAEGQLRFEGAWGQELLPREFSYEGAQVVVEINGPITNLAHMGQIQIARVAVPQMNPMNLMANWRGTRMDLGHFDLAAQAGASRLSATGRADLGGERKTFQLAALHLQTNDQTVLQLVRPAAGWWQAAPAGANQAGPRARLHLEGFELQGPGDRRVQLAVDAEWPLEGRAQGVIRNFDPTLFKDFLRQPVSPWRIHRLELAGGWNRGPAEFSLGLDLEVSVTNAPPLSVTGQLRATAEGLAVDQLVLAGHNLPAATAQGLLPVLFQPAAEQMLHVDPRKTVRLTVATPREAFVWRLIAQRTGVQLLKPELQLNLTGTLASPQGHILLQADQIQLNESKRPLPDLEQLQVRMELDREMARIASFRLRVQKQPVILTGELPLGEAFWQGVVNRRFNLPWERATGRLRVPPVELADLAKFIPEPLIPQGEFTADVALRSGGNVEGELRVGGMRTQPLPGVGPVENIRARLVFSGDTAKLADASAQISGQPVEVTGVWQWPARVRLEELPPFIFQVRGTQVPLMRRPDLVLRADLDLSVTNYTDKAPVISGVVQLRDSYYLSDLKDLMPGKVASPKRRPPYFSVENELLADWRLNVRVQGDKFLRVRSPLLRGEVSTTLRLEGTLKDPIALGEVKIDDGRVLFPFATLEVTQGLVTLTSENPHRPQLLVIAQTRRSGYEIRMEVTGPADAPVVEFSSTPPLSSEQLLLMVSVGQMPTETARFSTPQRTQQVAVFLGRNLLSDLGFGGGTEERLTVRSGEEVTAQGSPTYEVEYRLNEDWSVVGEYDRFNEFNVGVKWRIYSR